MNGQDIIARPRENEAALRARGVRHAALFGSRARGDNRPDSDSDIMIEIDPDAPVGCTSMSGSRNTSPVCSMDGSTSWIARA
jgi:predicted nucleotidyltransferase